MTSQIFTPLHAENGSLSNEKKIVPEIPENFLQLRTLFVEVVEPVQVNTKKMLPLFEPDVPYVKPRNVSKSIEEKLVIEGGKVKFATEGRQIEAADNGGVICDYLRFTVLRDRMTSDFDEEILMGSGDKQMVMSMAHRFAKLLGFVPGIDRPGRDYYDYSFTIENVFGQEVGSVSGGGTSQRDTFCFTLKGEGCTFALPGWEKRVSEFFAPMFPKITRIDLARDCWEHGQLSIDAAVTAFQDHAFSYRNRRPQYCQFGKWMEGEAFGGQHSRTFQVGKRESGKLIRVYEKGHQFGMMDSQWVRAEVELRSVNRVIPWEALTKTGDYFAGAYEFCNWLVHHLDKCPTPVKTQTMVAEVSVAKVMKWVERVVAPVLVQITSVLPDFDWLTSIVLKHADRPMPRGLRGLNHAALDLGMNAFFNRINSVPAPVVAPWSLTLDEGTKSTYSVHGLAAAA